MNTTTSDEKPIFTFSLFFFLLAVPCLVLSMGISAEAASAKKWMKELKTTAEEYLENAPPTEVTLAEFEGIVKAFGYDISYQNPSFTGNSNWTQHRYYKETETLSDQEVGTGNSFKVTVDQRGNIASATFRIGGERLDRRSYPEKKKKEFLVKHLQDTLKGKQDKWVKPLVRLFYKDDDVLVYAVFKKIAAADQEELRDMRDSDFELDSFERWEATFIINGKATVMYFSNGRMTINVTMSETAKLLEIFEK